MTPFTALLSVAIALVSPHSLGAGPELDAFLKSKNQSVSKTAPLPGAKPKALPPEKLKIPDLVYVSPGVAEPRKKSPTPSAAPVSAAPVDPVPAPPKQVPPLRKKSPAPSSPSIKPSDPGSEPASPAGGEAVPVLHAPYRVHSLFITNSGEIGISARLRSDQLASFPSPWKFGELAILKPEISFGVLLRSDPLFYASANIKIHAAPAGAAVHFVLHKKGSDSSAGVSGAASAYAFFNKKFPFFEADFLSGYCGHGAGNLPLTVEAVKSIASHLKKGSFFCGAWYKHDISGDWSFSAEAGKDYYAASINRDF